MNRRIPQPSTPSSGAAPRRAGLRRRSLLAAAVGGVALLLVSLAIQPGSSSADPAASASPTASAAASASASVAASAAPDAGPPIPRFDAQPFSEELSPRPSPAEWKPTEPVALTDPLPFNCNAYRLREWVKIRCSHLATSSLVLLGGAREGVFLFIDPPGEFSNMPIGGEVMFQVRRGDRRVFEWSTFGEAYEGPGFPQLGFVVSESWAPDEPAPTIIAR